DRGPWRARRRGGSCAGLDRRHAADRARVGSDPAPLGAPPPAMTDSRTRTTTRLESRSVGAVAIAGRRHRRRGGRAPGRRARRDRNQAEPFVALLIEHQILVSDAAPPMASVDSLHDFIVALEVLSHPAGWSHSTTRARRALARA